MSNLSMISPMVDNVAVVVVEQKTQDSTKRNKVEQGTGTGRFIDRIAHFNTVFFVPVKLSTVQLTVWWIENIIYNSSTFNLILYLNLKH